MSRDVKYIGMDTHKEAIVIAVRNASGKLVMESIVETKATSWMDYRLCGARCDPSCWDERNRMLAAAIAVVGCYANFQSARKADTHFPL